MSTVAQSPCSEKPNPDWNNQVKIGRGHNDRGAFHRAIDLAVDLFRSGQWNGRGLLIIHDPYNTHQRAKFWREPLVAGADYEFAGDSVYTGAGPAEPETAGVTPIAPVAEALLDHLSPMTLATIAAEMIADTVDNRAEWTDALQDAYHLVCRIGIDLVGEEEWDELVHVALAGSGS